MTIRVEGLNKFSGFIRNLPKNLDKGIGKESESFMGDVQKSAKLRAPRDTKGLKDSIHVELTGKNEWTLFVDSPHGVFQEEGFRPHPIPIEWLTIPGKGPHISNPKGWITVSKSTPFVRPALEHNLSKLAQRMGNATQRAVKGGK